MSIVPEITQSWSGCLSSQNTGLGNCLFQIAAVYGIAKKCETEAVYDTVVDFSDVLKSKYGYNHKNTIYRNFQKKSNKTFTNIEDKMWRHYDKNLIEAIFTNPSIDYKIIGYLEYPGYFKEYADEIRGLFSPDSESMIHIKSYMPYIFDGKDTVAIHIRKHGIILNFNLTVHSQKLEESYYIRAIDAIEKKIASPRYIVFSDTILEKIDFLEGKDYIVVNSLADYYDLWAMMHCKHYIMSHSTFCFWGWFLNPSTEKITVIPSIESLNMYDVTYENEPCHKNSIIIKV